MKNYPRNGKKLDTFSGDKSETGLKEYIARSVWWLHCQIDKDYVCIARLFMINYDAIAVGYDNDVQQQ